MRIQFSARYLYFFWIETEAAHAHRAQIPIPKWRRPRNQWLCKFCNYKRTYISNSTLSATEPSSQWWRSGPKLIPGNYLWVSEAFKLGKMAPKWCNIPVRHGQFFPRSTRGGFAIFASISWSYLVLYQSFKKLATMLNIWTLKSQRNRQNGGEILIKIRQEFI